MPRVQATGPTLLLLRLGVLVPFVYYGVKVTYRGKFAYKWTPESLVDGQWVEDSTTGLLFFPFWRAPRVEYRQNGLMKGG